MTEAAAPLIADVSYSRLEKFENCPAAFWHAYINHTPRDGFDRVESWTGSLVHKVLEQALRETLEKRVPDPIGIVQRFDEMWEETIGPHVLVVKDGKRLSDYRRNGRYWLRDYVDQAWPFLDATPLHVEEPVTFLVQLADKTPIRFQGILDRVDRLKDGRLRLIDYKTGAWMPDFTEPRSAFQLALYWRGLLERYPDTHGGVLVWHYLQHRLTRRIDPSPELVASAQDWLVTTLTEIRKRQQAPGDAAKQFPPRPGPLCRWCEYGYACAANPYRETAPTPQPTAPPSAGAPVGRADTTSKT